MNQLHFNFEIIERLKLGICVRYADNNVEDYQSGAHLKCHMAYIVLRTKCISINCKYTYIQSTTNKVHR